MFKGLRDKLKNALSTFSKSAQEEADEETIEEETIEEPIVEKPKELPPAPESTQEELAKEEVSESQAETVIEEVVEETVEDAAEPEVIKEPEEDAEPEVAQKPIAEETVEPEDVKEAVIEKPEISNTVTSEDEPEKKSFFSKIKEKVTTIQLSEDKFDELFWDIELALLENNVAVEVIEKIKHDLKEELTTGRAARGGLQERVMRRMQETLTEVLSQEPIDLLKSAEQHKPLVICIVGVNGSGKTTSIGKLGNYFQQEGKSVVFAAADTFRAAAIQQLQEHAKNLNIPCIAQSYGADPAAVAFDAIKHAEAKRIDVVLIDTAGRLHSNTNLMDELAKVVRVAKPHHTLFVGEAVTGNDCVEQARLFSQKTNVDGVILTKADVDDKGGAAVSVAYVTKKPILFIGTGPGYDDFEHFMPETVVKSLLGE